jgi:hypothetical protein
MNRRNFLRSSVAAGVTTAVSSNAMAALQGLMQVSGDVRAVTGDRNEISLEKAAVQELADSLRGNLLLPGNETTISPGGSSTSQSTATPP